jgi:hypothetical protein
MALNVSGRAAKVDRENSAPETTRWLAKIGLRVAGNMSFPRSRPTSSRSRTSHTVLRDPDDKSSAWNRVRRAGNAYADADRDVWLAVP